MIRHCVERGERQKRTKKKKNKAKNRSHVGIKRFEGQRDMGTTTNLHLGVVKGKLGVSSGTKRREKRSL